ncbi:YqhG family protein [Salipaludibacillus sp. CUR1]|uniref:YqhG family protein n=1 Tax=Salipaludibacillus sp. CUR1 TaxID=2820003 RepID=UPI001E3A8F91|nr:YqhG family protein [Salipaludibacillus sp. CUR1]MCE7794301.1 YqhG family protein [Salipaludibacillus sp. CUR1]
MQQTEICKFLKVFFSENGCAITETSPYSIQVQLTEELDKALMNRPFYWHYIEKMGGQPNLSTLSLKTDPNEEEGELIHFGSPRLHKIFSYVIEKGRFGQFFEPVPPEGNTVPLKPWLCLNGKIVYHCHQKKEEIFSIGLSLITGEMLKEFHSLVKGGSLKVSIPDFCFTLTPLIKPVSGIERIHKYLFHTIEKENHQWAEEAMCKMDKELALLERFYAGTAEKPPSYEKEKASITGLYAPSIQLEIINGGIFHLHNHPLTGFSLEE